MRQHYLRFISTARASASPSATTAPARDHVLSSTSTGIEAAPDDRTPLLWLVAASTVAPRGVDPPVAGVGRGETAGDCRLPPAERDPQQRRLSAPLPCTAAAVPRHASTAATASAPPTASASFKLALALAAITLTSSLAMIVRPLLPAATRDAPTRDGPLAGRTRPSMYGAAMPSGPKGVASASAATPDNTLLPVTDGKPPDTAIDARCCTTGSDEEEPDVA